LADATTASRHDTVPDAGKDCVKRSAVGDSCKPVAFGAMTAIAGAMGDGVVCDGTVFEALHAAEQRDDRPWVDDAACKNWAVAYAAIRGTPEQAVSVAIAVENAVNDATPNGPRDCQP
jgi:hypothetical protein